MKRHIHPRFLYVTLVAAAFSLAVVGCSSAPTDEEMRQLSDLKAEAVSLNQQISAKEKEKADLEKQIAEKSSKLEQCKADNEAVKKGGLK